MKSVDVKVDILILSFGEIQEANMVSFGVGMLVIFLLLKFFSNFLSQFSQNLPILNSVKIYSK